MSLFTSKTFKIIITTISLIGYGYVAFALVTPGQTLDPIADIPGCDSVGDVDCDIAPLGIGSDIAGTSNNTLLFIDNNGQLQEGPRYTETATTYDIEKAYDADVISHFGLMNDFLLAYGGIPGFGFIWRDTTNGMEAGSGTLDVSVINPSAAKTGMYNYVTGTDGTGNSITNVVSIDSGSISLDFSFQDTGYDEGGDDNSGIRFGGQGGNGGESEWYAWNDTTGSNRTGYRLSLAALTGLGFNNEGGVLYTFPTTAPSSGEVMGYVGANELGWVTPGVSNIDGFTDGANIGLGLGLTSVGTDNITIGDETLGAGFLTSGNKNVLIGYKSFSLGQWNIDYSILIGDQSVAATTGDGLASQFIAIGRNTFGVQGPGDYSIAIGDSAVANNTYSIAIGKDAYSQHFGSIAIGYKSTTTDSNQFVIGNDFSPIYNIYIGEGVTSPTPTTTDIAINATGGLGTNIDGQNLILAAGKGTGIGSGGDLLFQTADIGNPMLPTTLQDLSTKMIIHPNGQVSVGGDVSGAGLINFSVVTSKTDFGQNMQNLFWNTSTESVANDVSKKAINIAVSGDFTGGAGAPNKAYGIYIDTVSGADENYSIYAASGAYLSTGGTWTDASSRSLKENYTTIDPFDILNKINQLTIEQWNYISQDDSIKHIGPYAEEFKDVFGIGENNKSLATLDTAGVALVGIQALDLKITNIESFATATNTTFKDQLIAWLGDVANGVTKIFAHEVQTDKLCVGQTCLTEDQLLELMNNQNISSSLTPDPVPTDPNPAPEPTPDPDPIPTPEPTPEPTPDPIVE